MSNKLQAAGQIVQIGDTQTIGDKSFTKREFVIEIPDGKDPKWNQFIQFEFTKDNCMSLDAYRPGDHVTVDFNLRGREWKGRYFVNLQAWRIEKVGEHRQGAVDAGPPPSQDAGDGIPF